MTSRERQIKKIVFQLKHVTNRLEALNENCPITTADSLDAVRTDFTNLARDLNVAVTGQAF